MSGDRTFIEPIAPELAELIDKARDADGPDRLTQDRLYHRLAGTLALPLIPAAAATIKASGGAAAASGSAAAAGGAAGGVVAVSTAKTFAIAALVTAGIGAAGFGGWMVYSSASDNEATMDSKVETSSGGAIAKVDPAPSSPPPIAAEDDTEAVEETADESAASEPDAATPKPRKHGAESARATETAERLLIEAARQALRKGYPNDSLEILRRHKKKFSAGKFAEERDALTVMALAKAGHTARARKQAERFAVRYPGSMFIDAVTASLDSKQ